MLREQGVDSDGLSSKKNLTYLDDMPNRSSEAHLRNKSSISNDFGLSYLGHYDMAVGSSNCGTNRRQSLNEKKRTHGKIKLKKFLRKETGNQLVQKKQQANAE